MSRSQIYSRRPPVDTPGLELTICFDCVRLSTICWERAMSNKFCRVCNDKNAAVETMSTVINQVSIGFRAIFGTIYRNSQIAKILDASNTEAYFSFHCINERSRNDQATVKARST